MLQPFFSLVFIHFDTRSENPDTVRKIAQTEGKKEEQSMVRVRVRERQITIDLYRDMRAVVWFKSSQVKSSSKYISRMSLSVHKYVKLLLLLYVFYASHRM